MTNAELIRAIRNEIERLKTVQLKRIQEGDLVDAEPYDKNEAYNELLSFLDTIEPEKPMNQDGLKNEIERFFKDEGWDEYWKWVERPYQLMFGKTVIKFASNFYELGCRRTSEKYDEIEYNRQMAEESVPKDLEEAARHSEILTYPMPEDGDIEKVFKVQEARFFHEIGFIAGAKWQKEQDEKEQADLFTIVALDAAQRAKEQMMKEAVCYIAQPDITATGNIVIPFIRIGYTALSRYGIKVGDKVRIIILPKESEQ